MLPVLVFSRTGCVLCVLLPVSAIKIRRWLNRMFLCVASSGLFLNWVCVVCVCVFVCVAPGQQDGEWDLNGRHVDWPVRVEVTGRASTT